MGRYDKIIDLPHYKPSARQQMAVRDRAAQFSPFAALNGYEEAVDETARLTTERIELDETVRAEINEQLWLLNRRQEEAPAVTVTYFVQDPYKTGGMYITRKDRVCRVDEYMKLLELQDGTTVHMEDIYSIKLL